MNDPKNGSAKKASRKLKLNRTTIRQLSEEHLAGVGGNGTIVACDTGECTETVGCETGYCPTTDCLTIPSAGKPCPGSIPKHVC